MKKIVLSVVAALALSAAPAFAADMPVKAAKAAPAAAPPFDIAIGGVVMSDYNFRGVSQSNRGAVRRRLLRTGFHHSDRHALCRRRGLGHRLAERPWIRLHLAVGRNRSLRRLAQQLGPVRRSISASSTITTRRNPSTAFTAQSDFWEIYGKAAYEVVKGLTFGGNVFYTPDLLHYSTTFASIGISNKPDAVYGSVTGKWVLPWTAGDLGAYVSGELGHWWIDDTGFNHARLHRSELHLLERRSSPLPTRR